MARSDWRRPDLQPLGEGLRRIRLTVSYLGTNYCGWQRQHNGIAVAAVLEEAIETMIAEKVEIVGSGRTDSGVHALGQVCHMDISNPRVPAAKFAVALNRLLPPDIRILESEEVDGTFHARFTTMGRTYRYFFKEHAHLSGFDAGRLASVRAFPSMELLGGYASALEGTHDFTTFTGSGDQCPSKYRDIYESYWHKETDQFGYPVLSYTITGNAFLYRMIRSLVGSMMEFAEKEMSVEQFSEILGSCDRSRAGRTASAAGLYLWRISYDPDEYLWFEEQSGE